MYNHRLAIKERLERLLGNSYDVDILNSDFMKNLKEKIVEEFKRDVASKIRKRIADQMKIYKKSVKTGPSIDDKEIISEYPHERKSIATFMPRDISNKLEAIKSPRGKDKLFEEQEADFSMRIQDYSPEDDYIQEKIKELAKNLKEQACVSRQKSVKEKDSIPSLYERFVFPLLDEVCLDESKTLDEMYEAANSIIWRTDFIELWMAERNVYDEDEEEEEEKELEEKEVDISAMDLGQISGATMLSEIDSDIIEENLISVEQKEKQSIPKLPIEEIKDSANLIEEKEVAKDIKSEQKVKLIMPDTDIKAGIEETVTEKSVDKVSPVIPSEEKECEVFSSVVSLKEKEITEEIKDSANLAENKEFVKAVIRKDEEKIESVIPDTDINADIEATVPEKFIEDEVSSVIPPKEKTLEVVSSVIPPEETIEKIKDSVPLADGKDFAKDIKTEEKVESIISDINIKADIEETMPEKSVGDEVLSVIPHEEKEFEIVSSLILLKEEEISVSPTGEKVDNVTLTASRREDEMIPTKLLEQKDISIVSTISPTEYEIIQTIPIEEKESILHEKDATEITESLGEKEVKQIPSANLDKEVTSVSALYMKDEEITDIMRTTFQIKQDESSVHSTQVSKTIEESLSKECVEGKVKVVSSIEEDKFGLTKLDQDVNIISIPSPGEQNSEEVKIIEEIISTQDAEKVKSDEKLKHPSSTSEENNKYISSSTFDKINKDAALIMGEATPAISSDVIKENEDIQISFSEEVKDFIPTYPSTISAEIKKEKSTSGLLLNEREDISRADEKETGYTSVSEFTEITENISLPVSKDEPKDKISESIGMIVKETISITAPFFEEINQEKRVSLADEIKDNNTNISDSKIKLNDAALSQQFPLNEEKTFIDDKHELSDKINDITPSKIYSKKDTSTDFSAIKNDSNLSVKLTEDNAETRFDNILLSGFKNKDEIILTEHDSNIVERVNISTEGEESKEVTVDDSSNVENNLNQSLIENEKEITTSFSILEITTSELVMPTVNDQSEVIAEEEVNSSLPTEIPENETLLTDRARITKNIEITRDLTDSQSEKAKKKS